jgi:hypothetical protein
MTFVKPENRLYHYCRLSTALELILAEKKLLLCPINKSNDPRENKSFVFAAIFWQGTDIGNLEDRNGEISKILRDDCKMLCFSQDYEHFFGYESSRMWAYYGDNHKGLCLLIDKEEFLQENIEIIDLNLLKKIHYYEFDPNKPIYHKQVDHSLMKSMGEIRYLREVFRSKQLDYLYFTKNKEWESEQELRLVYFSEKKENEYCSIKNSLKKIFVGVDFHNSYLPSIIKLCPHVGIDKLNYKDVRLISNQVYKGN